ncbi:MAG TPA: nucleotidyltransferase family protein [Amycolatopsis sp.]|nr:nucleotidyltransferase family protein [Amycolatopsis sp.]
MSRKLCDESAYRAPLLDVAAYGLSGTTRELPGAPLADADWAAVLEDAGKHRLTGLLDAAITANALPATHEQVRQARAAHRTAQLRVLTLEHELAGIAGLLERAGIETRVLKGSALAHLDYAEPGLRSYNDIDILLRPDDIERAVAELGTAGFTRTLAEPRPGFDRRFDKGMTLRPAANYELDLHRTFVLGPWGRLVDIDDLWDEGQELTVGGRRMRALSRPIRFLHTCYHAALGNWPLRLGSLRDIAEVLRTVDEGSVRRIARNWGVEAIVAAAVSDTRRLLGIGGWSWVDGHVPSRREISWLGLHTRTDKTFAAQAVATLRVLPWRDRPAYVRALVLPDSRYTAGRHASPMSRFAYAIKEVRKGTR